MTRVVFHIGAHKCATTSFQEAIYELTRNDPSTEFISIRDRPNPMVQAVSRLTAPSAKGRDIRPATEAILRAAEANISTSRLIISDENMLGRMPGLAWSFYDRSDLLREVLDFVSLRVPTSVFLQSREPASYLRSCHDFRIRRGLTMDYAAFLGKFHIRSLSWKRLGGTLFDGARFRWCVLPIERVKDDKFTQSCIDMVYPAWRLSEKPLPRINVGTSPLVRCVHFALSRIGGHLTQHASAMVAAIEATIAGQGRSPEHVSRLAAVLDFDNMPIARAVAATALEDYFAIRASGYYANLQAEIRDRLADDYSEFVSRYVSRTSFISRVARAARRFAPA